MSAKDTMKAYGEGYKAAYWDKPAKDNPYPRDNPLNTEWYRGWYNATEDRKVPPLKYG